MKIAIINGPNLNLLGTRETDIYGNEPFETYLQKLRSGFPGITFRYFQSNVEGRSSMRSRRWVMIMTGSSSTREDTRILPWPSGMPLRQ